jgi:LysR family transcriptional regulator, nitrogen assimilation regulatory protein
MLLDTAHNVGLWWEVMDLRLVKTFVVAYEQQSFSKAATRLNATQPGVSNQIAMLEEELKTPLFDRKGRGVCPTHAGSRFYNLACKILRDIKSAEHEIRALSGVVTGKVGVGIPPTLGRAVLAPTLAGFVAAYPDVDVRVFEAYSDTLLSLVENGELDFALVAQIPDHPAVEYQRIYRDRFVLASGLKHGGIPPRRAVRLDVAPYYKLVVPSVLRLGLKRLLEEPLRTGRIVASRIIEIDGLSGALQFITTTDWVALLPAATAYNNPEGVAIQFNPIVGEEIAVDYFVAHLRTEPLSVAAQAFIGLTVAELSLVASDWKSRA